MQLPPRRRHGILIRRYKRFLADVELKKGKTLTVHCPNSGSMRGCSTPGSPVVISRSDNPKRKYPWTLELVRENDVWIGVNTALTNRLVAEALHNGVINDFGAIQSIRPEVRVGQSSRLDFLLETERGQVYLEVKNCSLVEENVAMFPDAVTSRGTRHLEELARLKADGHGAAILFCIQRADGRSFQPAAHIDPVYARTLREVMAKGVMALAYRAEVTEEAIRLAHALPVNVNPES